MKLKQRALREVIPPRMGPARLAWALGKGLGPYSLSRLWTAPTLNPNTHPP